MSIIYDALQKTQRNREYLRVQSGLIQEKPQHRRYNKWMIAGCLMLVVSAGFVAVFSFYEFSHIQPAAKIAVKAAPPATLKGLVPVSETQKTAEIVSSAPIAETQPVMQLLPPPETPAPVVNSSQLVLNGVLISGADKMALINNQAYHLGDIINGMKIIDIDYNSVKLQNGAELLELRGAV